MKCSLAILLIGIILIMEVNAVTEESTTEQYKRNKLLKGKIYKRSDFKERPTGKFSISYFLEDKIKKGFELRFRLPKFRVGETKDVKVWFKNRTPFEYNISMNPSASDSFEIQPMTQELTPIGSFGRADRTF